MKLKTIGGLKPLREQNVPQQTVYLHDPLSDTHPRYEFVKTVVATTAIVIARVQIDELQK